MQKFKEMKKLELKHLAPYLPYRLKIQGKTHGDIAEMSCVTDTSINITDRDFRYGMWADIFEINPILHPLSDLTKEMWKNKYDKLHDLEFENIMKYPNIICLEELSYFVINKLFKWHFDVFNLIPDGLAIDINEIGERGDSKTSKTSNF